MQITPLNLLFTIHQNEEGGICKKLDGDKRRLSSVYDSRL